MWFVELLAMMFADILGSAAWGATQRASDRRSIASNRVNCELRAVEGRVLNIGTEWSIGSGELSRGHVRFNPQIGIVGVRDIDVTGIRLANPQPASPTGVPRPSMIVLHLATAAGGLYLAVPSHLAEQVAERLAPTVANAQKS